MAAYEAPKMQPVDIVHGGLMCLLEPMLCYEPDSVTDVAEPSPAVAAVTHVADVTFSSDKRLKTSSTTRSPTLKQWKKVFKAAMKAARPCESMSYILQKAREDFEFLQW
jgi:hypothetical protein